MCVCVALVIQHAQRMRLIILSSVASLALQYLSTLSHKWHNFRNKVVEQKMCFDFLYNFDLKHFSFLKNNSTRRYHKRNSVFKQSTRYSCKRNFNFLDSFFLKAVEKQISSKPFQLEPSCSMRTDRRTEMTKLIVVFCNFAKASKSTCSTHADLNRRTKGH